jgi:arylsulfatase A-like enzyme
MHLFDDGWNKLRDKIFENQKRLGVIPANTQLEPWPTQHLKNWDDCMPEEKKLFIKQVEVFAAYVAYDDYEIGRVIDAIEKMGKLDDTLVIYINGDNGTSAEGGPLDTPNECAFFNGVNMMPVAVQMKWYDVWGTEQTYKEISGFPNGCVGGRTDRCAPPEHHCRLYRVRVHATDDRSASG